MLKVKNGVDIAPGDSINPIMPDEINCDLDGIANLMVGMMEQAKKDWIQLRLSHARWNDRIGGKSLREIDTFLKSEYGRLFMAANENLDAKTIEDNWDDQANHELWRRIHNCSSCKKRINGAYCVHKVAGHYTAPRECPKEVKNEKQ